MYLFAFLVFMCISCALTQEGDTQTVQSTLKSLGLKQVYMYKELESVKETVRDLKVQNEELRRSRDEFKRAESEKSKARKIVAFNAYTTESRAFPNDEVIVFPLVLLNKGLGYNERTGYFTAPITGLYFFSANTCQMNGRDMVIGIFHLKEKIAATTSSNSHSECTSVSAPAFVKKGEYVSVQAILSHNRMMADGGHRWPSFSGVLVRPA